MDILQIATETHDDVTVVRLTGEIDMSSVDLLRRGTLDVLHRGEPPRELVLDFAGVTFLDSSGIGALLDVHGKAAPLRTTVRLTNLSAGPRRAIRAAGLAPVLLGESGFVQPRESHD